MSNSLPVLKGSFTFFSCLLFWFTSDCITVSNSLPVLKGSFTFPNSFLICSLFKLPTIFLLEPLSDSVFCLWLWSPSLLIFEPIWFLLVPISWGLFKFLPLILFWLISLFFFTSFSLSNFVSTTVPQSTLFMSWNSFLCKLFWTFCCWFWVLFSLFIK